MNLLIGWGFMDVYIKGCSLSCWGIFVCLGSISLRGRRPTWTSGEGGGTSLRARLSFTWRFLGALWLRGIRRCREGLSTPFSIDTMIRVRPQCSIRRHSFHNCYNHHHCIHHNHRSYNLRTIVTGFILLVFTLIIVGILCLDCWMLFLWCLGFLSILCMASKWAKLLKLKSIIDLLELFILLYISLINKEFIPLYIK